MARYIGPTTRIARKFGEPIYGPDKAYEKKSFPPGQHGENAKRKKLSEYGTQLKEKQKVKYTYGLLERQFSNLFKKANRTKGITGEILIQLLESRLDNVVFRLGIAPSRNAARQLISHKHITVNGDIVNIPSYSLKAGEIIGIRERSKSLEVITNSLATKAPNCSWLEWDKNTMSGKFLNIPPREEVPENIHEQLIVELYSK